MALRALAPVPAGCLARMALRTAAPAKRGLASSSSRPKTQLCRRPAVAAAAAAAACGGSRASRPFRRPAATAARCADSNGEAGGATALFHFLRQNHRSWARRAPELPPELAKDLRAHLDRLTAKDLGLSPADVANIPGRSGIGYTEVHNGRDLTLCVFMLQAGRSLPLHDHPGMHVFGKLLFGKMRALSLDLDEGQAGLARLHSEEVHTGPTTYSLGPNDGNLHELEALENCAFFDVLTPPYDPWAGRDCSYFQKQPAEAPGRFFLRPVRMFVDMAFMPYRGPPCGL